MGECLRSRAGCGGRGGGGGVRRAHVEELVLIRKERDETHKKDLQAFGNRSARNTLAYFPIANNQAAKRRVFTAGGESFHNEGEDDAGKTKLRGRRGAGTTVPIGKVLTERREVFRIGRSRKEDEGEWSIGVGGMSCR